MKKKPSTKTVTFERMLVAGLEVRAPWQELWEEVPRAWRRVFERAAELDAIRAGPYVDVSLGKVRSEYVELIGVPVRSASSLPPGLEVVELPAQEVLHCTHRGPVRGIADTFGEMLAWAEQNGVKLGDLKVDLGYTPAGTEASHELYVGLAPETPWSRVRRS